MTHNRVIAPARHGEFGCALAQNSESNGFQPIREAPSDLVFEAQRENRHGLVRNIAKNCARLAADGTIPAQQAPQVHARGHERPCLTTVHAHPHGPPSPQRTSDLRLLAANNASVVSSLPWSRTPTPVLARGSGTQLKSTPRRAASHHDPERSTYRYPTGTSLLWSCMYEALGQVANDAFHETIVDPREGRK
jgi:hypothetical protein